MTHPNRVRLSKLSLGLMVALAAAPVFAQNTTSSVGGRITDGTGQPVSGAQITIVHVDSGTSSQATTGTDGRYISRGLRVGGPYTITISKDGKTETREGVYLTLAETETIDASLGAAATNLETVQVIGTSESPFSSTAMGSGTNISRANIESFASIKRDLQDYARQDPRVTQSTGLFGDSLISVAGQNNRFNSITIDGVTTSDTFGLESNGLPTAKQPISIDAIDSVQVNVSNYDVTQTAYIGANVNAVTKSGTNDFHGSLTYVFRNDSLSGNLRNLSTGKQDREPSPFKETTKGLTFGGPIIKDRLFFFVSAEDFESSRSGINFGPVGSDLTNVNITQAQIDQAIALAGRACGSGVAATCGMDVGTFSPPSGSALTVKDRLIKLDWNITDDHRASLRYNTTKQTEPTYRSINQNTLSLSSHWDTDTKDFENVSLQMFSDWTMNFSTEFKLAYRTFDKVRALGSDLPEMSIRMGTGSTAPQLRMGTERSSHMNELHTNTLDGYLGANWYIGDHQLKFGADLSRNDIVNFFQQNTKGQYFFECLLTAQCANSFEAGRPQTYTATVPQAGRTLQDAGALWGIRNIGAFVQDSWTVNNNLTLLYGVRIDRVDIDGAPLFQETAAGLSTSDPVVAGAGPYGRQTGGFGYDNSVTIDGKKLIQPRFGFNYTFDTERPTQLRGGFGLFQGASANVWLSNPFTNTGEAVQSTGCGGSLGACGVIFSNDPNNQPRATDSAPQLTVDIIDPDLGQPSVWKGNIGFEHELPWWNMVFSADLMVTKNKEAIYYQDLNRGEASLISPIDGRPMFYNASGYDTKCWNASGSINGTACSGGNSVRSRIRSNSAYGAVIIARPTSRGGAQAMTVSLSRPMKSDWSWSLAYTYTDATEVAALTSSTSGSQWGKLASLDANNPVESTSNYEIRHRFSGTLAWEHAFFGNYKTRAGLFFEGRSGKPYSWVYSNDMNGDGTNRSNDLLYIPNPGDGTVVFLGGAAAEKDFWAVVNQYDSLKRYVGSVVPRNSGVSPWVNQFDLRVSQELPGFWKGHKSTLSLDVLNVGNLINRNWGEIYESLDVESTRRWVNYVGVQNGKYVYSVNVPESLDYRDNRGESAWAAQLTLKYEF